MTALQIIIHRYLDAGGTVSGVLECTKLALSERAENAGMDMVEAAAMRQRLTEAQCAVDAWHTAAVHVEGDVS